MAVKPAYLTRALGTVSSSNSETYTYQGNFKKASINSTTTATTFKNKFDIEVDVNTFQLTPTAGHLIIGSSGFWEVVAPPAVALRAHLFSNFQQAQKNVVDTAIKDGVPLPSPAERANYLAEHLINFAVSTAADRLNADIHASSSSTARVNAEDLRNLPFQIDSIEIMSQDDEAISAVTANTDGSSTEGGSSSGANEEENKEQQLARKDVFGDLACVVISLSWPTQGHIPMFQPPPPRLFHPTPAGRTRREALSPFNFQESSSSDLAPLARYRWAQLRMVVDYHRLHRREVLQRWQETVNGILKKAQQRAKAVAYQVENEHGIAINVSPLMKLSAKDGHSLPSSAFNVRASINF
ncbi:hypothetical protein NADE_002452 [Nannochloris sp. 'desiccata']|nr:hypothetical protein NADE_002452 [Chlorella desiccata (nom. nud.)]